MNNIKYPDFKFDKWLKEYIIADNNMSGNEFMTYDPPIEDQIDEQKEAYDNQIHATHDEEYFCKACEHLNYIKRFSEFMIILQTGAVVELEEVLVHFLTVHLYHHDEQLINHHARILLDKLNIKYDGTPKVDIQSVPESVPNQ